VPLKLIVFSALILLHEAHASRSSDTSEYFERIHHTKNVTNNVKKSREEIVGFETPIKLCVRAAAPFMTSLLYQMATANLRRCQDLNMDKSYEDFVVLKEALKVFDGRWRASGEWHGRALAES
jgi:hypothetical protein